MNRLQLEQAIRAACDVAKDPEIWIFGSQAILGSYPDAPVDLCASIEVDVQPKNKPENTDAIDGNLGELSLFHKTHGFYVHGVSLETAAFPAGWQKRVKRIWGNGLRGGSSGLCIEPHDLAASKLVAFREKDRDFVRSLLINRMIKGSILKGRIKKLESESGLKHKLMQWIDITVEDI